MRRTATLDLLPRVAALIAAAARATVLSRAKHKGIYDYRIDRRQPSYGKLDEILRLLAAAAAGEAYRRLEELHRLGLFWAEVTTIAEGEGDVYDPPLPGSHSLFR